MNNKDLLVVENNSIFSKIKNYFKKLFKGNKYNQGNNEVHNMENDFRSQVKYDKKSEIDSIGTIQDLLKRIEKTPELLYQLSESRLDVLIEYYRKNIDLKEKRLKKLESKI